MTIAWFTYVKKHLVYGVWQVKYILTLVHEGSFDTQNLTEIWSGLANDVILYFPVHRFFIFSRYKSFRNFIFVS